MRLTPDVRVVKRAQALLWLSEGDTPEEVAARLWVTPRTIYRWVERFERRDDWPLAERLADAPRSGRPDTMDSTVTAPVLKEGPSPEDLSA